MAVAGMCLRDGGPIGDTQDQSSEENLREAIAQYNRMTVNRPSPFKPPNIDSVDGAVYEPDDEGIEAELVAGVVE